MKTFILFTVLLSLNAHAESDFERGFNAGKSSCQQRPVCIAKGTAWKFHAYLGAVDIGSYVSCDDLVSRLLEMESQGRCTVEKESVTGLGCKIP